MHVGRMHIDLKNRHAAPWRRFVTRPLMQAASVAACRRSCTRCICSRSRSVALYHTAPSPHGASRRLCCAQLVDCFLADSLRSV